MTKRQRGATTPRLPLSILTYGKQWIGITDLMTKRQRGATTPRLPLSILTFCIKRITRNGDKGKGF